MNIELHIGNVSSDTTETELRDLFSRHGPVAEINLLTDRSAGRSHGFAFVTMSTLECAQAAIETLNGAAVGGRFITVNKARPRDDRPKSSFDEDRAPRRNYKRLY